VARAITFYDEKEAAEYAKGLQKQGWNVARKRGRDPRGDTVWVVSIYGTAKTIGRAVPSSLSEMYAEEETVAQRATLPPKLATMKPEKLAGELAKESERRETSVTRIEKRLKGVKSPEKRRDIAEELALARARPGMVERAISEEQRKLAKMKPEERIKRLAETRRTGIARAEVAKYVSDLKQKEAIAEELRRQGLMEQKPLIPRVVERAKLEKRLKVPAQFVRTGARAAKGVATTVREEVLAPKTYESMGKSLQRQASMRKAIPVSAQMAQRRGKDYSYLARIGKTGAPAISEASYPTQDTIAQIPSQVRIAQMPSRVRIAQYYGEPEIVYSPRRPRIATLVSMGTAGSIADMPYLRRKKEDESEESSGSQQA
jgi:hypothetical protein